MSAHVADSQQLHDDIVQPHTPQASIARTSFDLEDITKGSPLLIYLILPPHMLESHGRLLRLWLGALIT